MARSTRTDYAKVKVWLPNMTSEMEGPISGIAFELFGYIASPTKRELILKLMQERHEALIQREAERDVEAAQGAK